MMTNKSDRFMAILDWMIDFEKNTGFVLSDPEDIVDRFQTECEEHGPHPAIGDSLSIEDAELGLWELQRSDTDGADTSKYHVHYTDLNGVPRKEQFGSSREAWTFYRQKQLDGITSIGYPMWEGNCEAC